MILLIDNYDSFVHNLARYFRLLGFAVQVCRNDAISVNEVEARVREGHLRCVVLSPGPCSPTQAGICLPLVARLYQQVPLLGVCLGHQAIAQALGGDVVQWHQPVHGQADEIDHDGQHDFQGLPNPLLAGRYHSLAVAPETLPYFFDVSARLSDGTIMAIRHRRLPIVGYQFHPESILTPAGMALLAGYLKWVGLPVADANLARAQSTRKPAELLAEYPPGCRRSHGNGAKGGASPVPSIAEATGDDP